MKSGDKFDTKSFGTVEVIEYRGAFDVDVRFLDTGFIVTTNAGNVRNGSIKDKLKRTVYGVGFFGDGKHKSSVNKKPNPAYKAWKAMMQRCYDHGYHKYRPTYIDCTVCDDWHNFQNFADWFEEAYPRDGNKYQVDKDSVKVGNKVYSPETCVFLTLKDNTVYSGSKVYRMISPGGEVINIFNMTDFCNGIGLDPSTMVKVANGKRKQYKGWKAGSIK